MKRALALAAVAFIVLAAWPGLPSAAAVGPVVRSPILVWGDAAFTAANGVRSGAGTAADPYVISDWIIDSGNGPAIQIRGTTKHVVIRDVVVTTQKSGDAAIDLRDNTGRVFVQTSTINHRGFGIQTLGGTAIVDAVTIRDTGSFSFFGAGVHLRGSHALVANSTFLANDRAVLTSNARLNASANLVVSGLDGFTIVGGVATLLDNEIQSSGRAVDTTASANVTVRGGLVTRPEYGLRADDSVVLVEDVRVDGAKKAALYLEDSRSTVRSLVVVGGAAGVDVVRGRADVATSTFESVAGTALRFLASAGTADANVFLRSGGGVAVDGGSVVAVTSNIATSNAWGVGIDYASRASIPLLAGNVVNGIPLAGVFRWRDANVAFSGSVDSGHGAGFSGSLAREGLLVLYDVQEASIVGATMTHGTAAVHAVNSFNVVVEGSLLLSNRCGVIFNSTVGFVKNTTIDIPVDPPLTCGVQVVGGFAGVVNNTIRRVDVGVDLAAGVRGNVSGNVVTETQIGIRVAGGSSTDVLVAGNLLVGNVVGLETRARFSGAVVNNTIRANLWSGVRVEGAANFTFVSNVVVENRRGVEDATPCAAANGRVRFEKNVVANNTETGVALNGTVVMRSNRVVDNGADGAIVCGRVEGRANVFARNGEDGLEVRGSISVDGDAYVENQYGAGLRLTGTLFVIVRANISANFDGIFAREPLPELPPVPQPTIPATPAVPTLPCFCANVDPVWVHASRIASNFRYAISASPQTDVNATHNWWGTTDGPDLWIPQYSEFGNVVSTNTRFVPYYRDAAMTDRAPI